jgi:two-component system phosphate regulon response regulator PhoB
MRETMLFWSRKGVVACRQHAPEPQSDQWNSEGWKPILPADDPRARYQCQYCSATAITRRTRDHRNDGPPLILNVDDRPANLYARDQTLRKYGFTVANADCGAVALDVARQLRPRLVLLDVHLPDIDGRVLCQRIKADAELADISVVLISATLRGHVAQLESLDWGKADAFIAEPVEPDALAATLWRVLGAA